MPKYTTKRPRARWCDEIEMDVMDPAPLTVYEPDDEPAPTGLLDAQGNELFRVRERNPIGYK